MRTARLWMLVFVGLIGCSVLASAQAAKTKAGDNERDPEIDRWITRFLAAPRLAALREADRIDALPVDIIGGGLQSTFHVVERPVVLDAATTRQVHDMVTRPRSYDGGPTACIFEPGLALRFHKGRDSVQMLICFLCHEVLFQTASGRAIGHRIHYDKDVLQLLPIARKAFPDNPGFQSLP